MKVRFVVLLLCALALPVQVCAQAAEPPPLTIGWLTVAPHPFIDAFRQGMRDHRYVEGRNLTILARYAGMGPHSLPALAETLRDSGVAILVVSGNDALAATVPVVTSIPVVFAASDPIQLGAVRSLARPGGNFTGISLTYEEAAAKWIELLNEAVPQAGRIAVMTTSSPGNARQFDTIRAGAIALGKRVDRINVTAEGEFASLIDAAAQDGAEAMIVVSSPFFAAHRHAITASAAAARLPAVYEHRAFVQANGLMSYGPDLSVAFRRLASYVARIAAGASPSDLPVEQPDRYEFLVNLRAARALGIAVPESLLARADEVIE